MYPVIVHCKKCKVRLYSGASKEKELCVSCDPNKGPGGVSAAEIWLRGVRNA